MVQRTTASHVSTDPATGIVRVNGYRLLAEFGRGTFSRVQLAEDDQGVCFAVKAMSKAMLARRHIAHFDENGATTIPLRQRVDEEIRLLASLSHKNVMPLLEIIDDANYDELFVVFEGFLGGQLMTWHTGRSVYEPSSDRNAVRRHWGDTVVVRSGNSASIDDGTLVYHEDIGKNLFRQLLQGVAYLHSQRVIHKDLKPDNILLSRPVPVDDRRFVRRMPSSVWTAQASSQGDVAGVRSKEASSVESDQIGLAALLDQFSLIATIGDFNSAEECADPECLTYDKQGTQQFTPPECFEGGVGVVGGKPRDMWSLGCVLFTMLLSRCPYWADENCDLQFMILQEDFVLPSLAISSQAEELIRSLMQRDSARRLTAEEAVQSEWFAGLAA